ncbi:MAG: FAD-dependent oxidoreductase, partial [Spirochaetes bacterium]|nr:FAD-dependent oxidoreductase [Spirochaetota bacterium]
MNYLDQSYDLVVCGGGIGGVVTAVTAARKGLSVALVDNKAGLGGNACSEIGVSVDGATFFGYFANMREGGPVEEMKERFAAADPFFHNGQNSTTLLFWCEEAGVKVFCEWNLHGIEKEGRRLTHVLGSQGGTERNFRFAAKQFVDATGDATVAALAGCAFMSGREAKETFGEILAPDKADSGIMGASLLYRASEKKVPSTFVRPEWAYEYKSNDDLPHRLTMYKGAVDCGFWWIEYAGDHDDPIGEYEHIRKELLKCVYGVWAFLKNDPERKMEYWALDRVSVSPAKRESRRVVGDVVVTERDIVERTPFPDAVSYAGWNIDIHVPGGFKSRLKPNIHAFFPWVFPIPLRSLYAKDMDNLWIVGRDMSVSHVALGATRLQATIGAMGHAVGCAAATAQARGTSPRETAKAHIGEVQQAILKDGSFIPGVRNTDPADRAPKARITASSDQPLAFTRGPDFLPIGQGRALSFPLVGGRLDRVVLPLRNPGAKAVPLRLFFSACLHPNHFTDRGSLAETTILLAPGLHETPWSLQVSGLPDGLYAIGVVPQEAGAVVDWMQSATEPYGCYTGLLDPERYFFPKKDTPENLYAVEKTILVAAEGEDARWVRQKKGRLLQLGRKIDRSQVPLPFVAL